MTVAKALPRRAGKFRELVWRGKYAAAAGKSCHDCAFLRYTASRSRYPKCGKTEYTHGDATTIKTRTAACRLFEDATP